MALKVYQFDKETVPAMADALLFDFLQPMGIARVVKGMELGISGMTVSVGQGFWYVQGRMAQVTSPEVLDIKANSSGYIVAQIDLSATNISQGAVGTTDYTVKNNQISIRAITTPPVKQELNGGGTLYQLVLATFSANATSVMVSRQNDTYETLLQRMKSVLGLPVGSIITTVVNKAPDYGTWVAWGQGRVVTGVNPDDVDFKIAEVTGGKSKIVLTYEQIPAHTHTMVHTHTYSGTAASAGAHEHIMTNSGNFWIKTPTNYGLGMSAAIAGTNYGATSGSNSNTSNTGSHGHSYSGTTSASSAANTGNWGGKSGGVTLETDVRQPYITAYMFKRIA